MSTTFAAIDLGQLAWLGDQGVPVVRLWAQSWTADVYGRWQDLSTDLPPSSFKKARGILQDAGMFHYRPLKSSKDARQTIGWQVRNLHPRGRYTKQAGSESIEALPVAPIVTASPVPQQAAPPPRTSRSKEALEVKEFRDWYDGVMNHPYIDYIDASLLPQDTHNNYLVRWLGRADRPPNLRHDLIPWRDAAARICDARV